ncbi:uncharacterized protein BDZ99DRAFT_48545 [Mytilinidion resinicola]|uniref:Uncharacterized protein n=1 Tax=Mytilinidion resinicola TaxID=574789 RepID=A0A6A6YH76_9PEZI|nr:uncharacterized protein BDZ99DRAFT_48545 [Mytilinidion resinicola]KAF2808166.1 hypothetical protein BDZ99DRAFT_48545 [Mytilinidion resinicola]
MWASRPRERVKKRGVWWLRAAEACRWVGSAFLSWPPSKATSPSAAVKTSSAASPPSSTVASMKTRTGPYNAEANHPTLSLRHLIRSEEPLPTANSDLKTLMQGLAERSPSRPTSTPLHYFHLLLDAMTATCINRSVNSFHELSRCCTGSQAHCCTSRSLMAY